MIGGHGELRKIEAMFNRRKIALRPWSKST
jgi:hypothetical protein